MDPDRKFTSLFFKDKKFIFICTMNLKKMEIKKKIKLK